MSDGAFASSGRPAPAARRFPLVFAADGPARFDERRIARVAVVGGESSGKSTLVNALGERYGEPCVAEYGRTLWVEQGGRVDYDDLRAIGRRHIAHEEAAMSNARRCVFVDTTPLTTLWYSIDGYGHADPDLVESSWRAYDLILVCAPDFAFVQDGSRSSDDFRLRHDRWIRAVLRARGADYVDVRGGLAERLDQVAALIDPWFEKPMSVVDAPTSRVFAFQVRVYYEDTDTGGIVFYANYLKFFERARTEWLRHGSDDAPGISQQQVGATHGLMFVVRSTTVDYRRPARLDDAIRIVSRVERLGRVGIDFHQEAYLVDGDGRADTLLAVGRIKVGCVSREALKPTPIPDAVRLIFVAR